jgi:hypothetical protein
MPTPCPAVRLMRNFALIPDPWQVEVLESHQRQLLLNCCRQAGKSTVVALLALAEALFHEGSRILLVSRSLRQSSELFRIVKDFYVRLNQPLRERLTRDQLQLTNRSQVICLPCSEPTVRGFSDVRLLVIDEAARVPDDLYRAVRPMLATSNGRLICLSTPYGKRGFFYDCWVRGGADWQRLEIPATQIPRIRPDFLEQERRALGEAWFRQEYACSFEALEGMVYPDFVRCLVPRLPPSAAGGARVGGIDFGFRNPFAAVWGFLDRDKVLWLTGEHYVREKHLGYHAERLPREVTWYADPAGAGDIAQLCSAGFKVHRGNNDIRLGIAAVRARLENGTLRVLSGACPNLLAEAGLYRYTTETGTVRSETPVDEHNHALGALRYLISKLDARLLARMRKRAGGDQPTADTSAADTAADGKRPADKWLRYSNEALWTRLF